MRIGVPAESASSETRMGADRDMTIIVNKRFIATAYADRDNELFKMDKVKMFFCDAKKIAEDMIKGIENACGASASNFCPACDARPGFKVPTRSFGFLSLRFQ